MWRLVILRSQVPKVKLRRLTVWWKMSPKPHQSTGSYRTGCQHWLGYWCCMNEGNVVADDEWLGWKRKSCRFSRGVIKWSSGTDTPAWPTLVATRSEISCNTGVILEKTLTFNRIGHIIKEIRADAQQAVSWYLSGSTRSDTNPILLIDNDVWQAMLHRSVRWTQKIWQYLMSRGLDQPHSRTLSGAWFLGICYCWNPS